MKIAYSPCPNDTFVFHAWAHGLIEGAPPIDVTFADIDVTNTAAERGEFDVVKVSYAALPWLLDDYTLLPCGGALGRGCGPLVLTRGDVADLDGRTVAVPSERSTAYLLFRLWAAGQRPARIDVVPFTSIMPAVRDGTYDAGLVIHEARFTYPSLRADRRSSTSARGGSPTPACRSRSARSWPGAGSTPTLLTRVVARLGRARVGRPGGLGGLRRRARRRDVTGRPGAAHRALRQRVHPRPRRRGLRRGRGAARAGRSRRGLTPAEPRLR